MVGDFCVGSQIDEDVEDVLGTKNLTAFHNNVSAPI
jgi:hypothetical protein